jgi:E3 ubiquitin-protein ligase HECTD4
VDIDLLQRHTVYSGVSPDSPHIQYFWSVLRDFSQEDRRKFVRFAWAQVLSPPRAFPASRKHPNLSYI